MLSEAKKDLVHASEFNFTKTSGIVAAFAAAGSAVVPLMQTMQGKIDTEVIHAAVPLLAVGVVGIVISASVDVLARAWITSAELRNRSPEVQDDPQPGAALATSGGAFALRALDLTTEPLSVVAVRWDPVSKMTHYLVGAPGARPRWLSETEVVGLSPLQPNGFAPHTPNGTSMPEPSAA